MTQVTMTVRTDANGKKRDTRQEFGDLLNSMHQAAIERDEPELTLEEINDEIAAARNERRARLEKGAEPSEVQVPKTGN